MLRSDAEIYLLALVEALGWGTPDYSLLPFPVHQILHEITEKDPLAHTSLPGMSSVFCHTLLGFPCYAPLGDFEQSQ